MRETGNERAVRELRAEVASLNAAIVEETTEAAARGIAPNVASMTDALALAESALGAAERRTADGWE